jgi:hypothetical protein
MPEQFSGEVVITNAAGVTVFRFNDFRARLDLGPSLGGEGSDGELHLFGADGETRILLDGNSADIYFRPAGEEIFSLRNLIGALNAQVASLNAQVASLDSRVRRLEAAG